jgi:hypothetical protein
MMAKDKKPDHVSKLDGYKVEWRRRRDCTDGDVYTAGGELIGELEYPKTRPTDGALLDDFAREAVEIAKREERANALDRGE